jgi:hypothetical protein
MMGICMMILGSFYYSFWYFPLSFYRTKKIPKELMKLLEEEARKRKLHKNGQKRSKTIIDILIQEEYFRYIWSYEYRKFGMRLVTIH